MRTGLRFVLSLVFLVAAPNAFADIVGDAKVYLEKGLQVYVESGPKPFIEYLMKNGALEGNPQTLSQANVLQQIQDLGGKPMTYEVSSVTKLSERAAGVLYVIHLEKLPVFGNALLYRTAGGSMTVVSINFNTVSDKVWPLNKVYGAP